MKKHSFIFVTLKILPYEQIGKFPSGCARLAESRRHFYYFVFGTWQAFFANRQHRSPFVDCTSFERSSSTLLVSMHSLCFSSFAFAIIWTLCFTTFVSLKRNQCSWMKNVFCLFIRPCLQSHCYAFNAIRKNCFRLRPFSSRHSLNSTVADGARGKTICGILFS